MIIDFFIRVKKNAKTRRHAPITHIATDFYLGWFSFFLLEKKVGHSVANDFITSYG
jgi:hypothetical protein